MRMWPHFRKFISVGYSVGRDFRFAVPCSSLHTGNQFPTLLFGKFPLDNAISSHHSANTLTCILGTILRRRIQARSTVYRVSKISEAVRIKTLIRLPSNAKTRTQLWKSAVLIKIHFFLLIFTFRLFQIVFLFLSSLLFMNCQEIVIAFCTK